MSNNSNDDYNSSDEDEENIIIKEYQLPSERRGYKRSTNINNSIYNSNNDNLNNIKNNNRLFSIKRQSNKFYKKFTSILQRNNNLKNTIITSIFVISLFLILLYFFKINSKNNIKNFNSYKNNNHTNSKIINYNTINNYCYQFTHNKNKKEEKEIEEGDEEDRVDEKCTFDINSPNYICTPTSKNRIINYNYQFDNASKNHDYKPTISVIIPFLNTESHIFSECIESILIRQSFKSIEVILVDDGSTNDESIKTYREWIEREPIRFKVIVNPINLGLPHSRNIGIVNSLGDYIFFFDSDDILEPTALEKLLWKLNTSNHIQFTKGYLVGFGSIQYIWTKGFEARDQFLTENQITISILYKRSVFGKLLFNGTMEIGKDDGIYKYPKELLEFQYDSNIVDGMEDWDFHLKCASKGYWGETLPEILEWYRRKDQLTSEKNWKNTISSKRDKFIQNLKSKYSKLYENPLNFPNPIKNQLEKSYDFVYNGLIKNLLVKENNVPRILLILPWLNTGGADKFNLNLCKLLREEYGWEITIVTTIESDNKWLSRFQLYSSDIFLYNDKFLEYSEYPSFICYLITSRKIDVLFTSNSEFGYYLLPFIKQSCPVPSLIDYNHMEEENWRNGGHPRQSIAMNQFLDIQFVSSNHLKKWMIQKNEHSKQKENNKLTVLYINVDMKEFNRNDIDRQSIRSNYKIDDRSVVILYAARLTDQKKPLEACEIIKQLKEELSILDKQRQLHSSDDHQNNQLNTKFKVLFVGDGYLREKVESFINKNGLSDVIKILGDVPTQDMKSIISASDIVFLPSLNEGISMIFYESMSIGVVPVGVNIGGQNELVTKDCGYLIDVNNINTTNTIDFTNKFVPLLKQLVTSGQKSISKMGLKCKKRIRSSFQLEKMCNNFISNICNQINSKQQRQEETLTDTTTNFNKEFLIQTIEFLKLSKQFDKNQKEFNQLYSLQSQIVELKREIKLLELKPKY